MFFGDSRFLCKGILAVILIGLVVRMAAGALITYNYDVYHWALTISNFEAGNGLYQTAGYYYTPVWGYILGIFSRFYELFGVDMLGERFTDLLFVEDVATISPHTAFVTSIPFNTAVTAMMALVDLTCAYLIFWIVRETYDLRKAKICFAAWFLCSFVIVVGSIGGMFDSISALMTLLCICMLMRGKEFLAGSLFATAVLLKLFPAFLIFIFIAYIIVKHREEWKIRVLKALLGAVVFTGILMAPMVMQGTLMDSMSFIIARTSSDALYCADLVRLGTPVAYILAVIMAMVLGYFFIKKEHKNVERALLIYSFYMMAILFLIPGAPQYQLLLFPFLVIMAICVDGRFRIPMAIVFLLSSIHMLSPLVMDFVSMAVYTDILSLQDWTAFYNMFDYFDDFLNMPGFDVWSTAVGFLDSMALLLVSLVALKRLITVRAESAHDGLRKDYD